MIQKLFQVLSAFITVSLMDQRKIADATLPNSYKNSNSVGVVVKLSISLVDFEL